MESWITLFTAHGKAKVQLSHVLQTELPTIQRDSQLYTFPQCRLLRRKPPPLFLSFVRAKTLKGGITIRNVNTGYMIRAPTFRRSTQRQEPHPLQLNTAAPQNLRSAGTAAFTRGRLFCAAAYADRLLSACRTAADAAERIYLWHFSIAQ